MSAQTASPDSSHGPATRQPRWVHWAAISVSAAVLLGGLALLVLFIARPTQAQRLFSSLQHPDGAVTVELGGEGSGERDYNGYVLIPAGTDAVWHVEGYELTGGQIDSPLDFRGFRQEDSLVGTFDGHWCMGGLASFQAALEDQPVVRAHLEPDDQIAVARGEELLFEVWFYCERQ